MTAPHDSLRRRRRERRLAGFAIALSLFSVLYASPVFLAASAIRGVLSGMSIPRAVDRVIGPWGDAYLVHDDGDDGYRTLYDRMGREICSPSGGLDGEGDGRCPGLMALRFASIRIWSTAWVE
jgi:hypothetical protein